MELLVESKMQPLNLINFMLGMMESCNAKDKNNNISQDEQCGGNMKGKVPQNTQIDQNYNVVHRRIMMIGIFSSLLTAVTIYYTYIYFVQGNTFYAYILGSIGFSALLVSLLCLDIILLSPASTHTATTLLFHYAMQLVIRSAGWLSWRTLQHATKTPVKYQHDLLMNILKENAHTEYGLKYEFDTITSCEEFRKKVPLADYEHYSDQIIRIASGDKNILTKEDAVFMALTSGTTGEPKMYPLVKSTKIKTGWICLGVLYHYRKLFTLGRTQDLRLYPRPRKTINRLPMGGITLHLFKPMPHHVVPPHYSKLHEEKPVFYVLAVFMLVERELGSLECFSSNLLYSFFNFIMSEKENICRSIELGELMSLYGITESIRKELNNHMHPDPERAHFLWHEFSKGTHNLAKRIWPTLSFVPCVKTGSFAHCAQLLEQSYMKEIPLVTVLHVATEGNIGAQIEDDHDSTIFTFLPHSCFLEFIPLEEVDKSQPATVFIDQLKENHSYEIVITNTNGLYRIRLGDIITICGKYNCTPSYTFEYRMGQLLDIRQERTPESIIYKAIQETLKLFPQLLLIDYTTTESFNIEAFTGAKNPSSCYIFFMEFKNTGRLSDEENLPKEILEEKIDGLLCQYYEMYDIARVKGSISQLHIIQVKGGTFDELKRIIMGPYPHGQFKQPRVTRDEMLLRFLLEEKS